MSHGTRSCYNRGCRRPECAAANAAYAKRWRHRTAVARMERLDPANCGTRTQYAYYGCRCEKCCKAEGDYQWRRRYRDNPNVLAQPRRDRRLKPPKPTAALPPGTRLDQRELVALEELLAS